MKTAIVTGANGFVGSAVVKELLKNNYYVYALARPNRISHVPIHDNLKVLPCELSEIKIFKEMFPECSGNIFYHFAWAGSAGEERGNTALQLQNVQWTVDALRTAKEIGCDRFVCAGSITEHETIVSAYEDGNHPGMGYIYGAGKVAAHIMCMSVATQIGIDLIWPEISNAYGIGEISPRLVNSTLRKCIQGICPEFTSGTQNYDFVYIDDVARAFRMIGENGRPFHRYLIGSSNPKPLKEFLMEMQRAVAPQLEFKFGDIPFTGVDLPLSVFNSAKTRAHTGFQAEVSFSEGCKKTIEWLKNQENVR